MGAGTFKRPKPKLLQHAIMESIEQAIWRGDLPHGSHIVEVELVRIFNVSRGSVREALRQLEQKGLVRYEPYRGFFVPEWTRKELEEVQSLRLLLETYAAELAAQFITDDELEDLETIVEKMRTAARQDDWVGLLQLDAEFHESIARYSRHGLLSKQVANFSPYIRMFISLSRTYRVVYPDLMSIAETHVPVIEGLRTRDPRRARDAIHHHIVEVGDVFLQIHSQKDKD